MTGNVDDANRRSDGDCDDEETPLDAETNSAPKQAESVERKTALTDDEAESDAGTEGCDRPGRSESTVISAVREAADRGSQREVSPRAPRVLRSHTSAVETRRRGSKPPPESGKAAGTSIDSSLPPGRSVAARHESHCHQPPSKHRLVSLVSMRHFSRQHRRPSADGGGVTAASNDNDVASGLTNGSQHHANPVLSRYLSVEHLDDEGTAAVKRPPHRHRGSSSAKTGHGHDSAGAEVTPLHTANRPSSWTHHDGTAERPPSHPHGHHLLEDVRTKASSLAANFHHGR